MMHSAALCLVLSVFHSLGDGGKKETAVLSGFSWNLTNVFFERHECPRSGLYLSYQGQNEMKDVLFIDLLILRGFFVKRIFQHVIFQVFLFLFIFFI